MFDFAPMFGQLRMALVGVGRSSLLAMLLFSLFPANAQFPMGNGTLRDLLNSTDVQKAFLLIYQSLNQINWASISRSVAQMDLGQCGKDITALMNDKTTMVKCE